MKASLPEISAVSWPSFMTGANPGRHGIFGFTDFKDNSYEFRVLSSADVQAPTIWDKLGAKGRRSVVINQPSTYPARKIDGTLISGFVAIEMRKAVFPLRLLGKLVREGYTIDVNAIECRENPHRLKAELQEMLASRRKALDLLWDEEDWDYLELVVTGTDRLHHFLWDALDGESHPYHDMFIDYYREVDMLVGDIFDRFQRVNMSDEAGQGFYMLSDHGFTGIRQEVYINRWLQENGYLEFDTETPESLGAVTGATRAFALDPARIYVNTRDRFQRGTVDADDVPDVVEEIKSAAMELEFEGSPVVKWAFARDEIYSGPCTSQGPDLVLVPNDGFDLKGSVKEKQVFGRSNLQGMHTWENAMFWSQQGVETDDLKISDLAEVILSEFND
jgi:predicted AlkP superfamily phosphohydrolase/phosphomutase